MYVLSINLASHRDGSRRPRHRPKVWLIAALHFWWVSTSTVHLRIDNLILIDCSLVLWQSGFQHLTSLLIGQLPVFRVLDFNLELAYGIHEAKLIFKQGKILRQSVVLNEPVKSEPLFGKDNYARLEMIRVIAVKYVMSLIPKILVLVSDEFCLNHLRERPDND